MRLGVSLHQQDGANGLGGVSHVDWSTVTHHLRHVRQCSTVVQVEVAGGGRMTECGLLRGSS